MRIARTLPALLLLVALAGCTGTSPERSPSASAPSSLRLDDRTLERAGASPFDGVVATDDRDLVVQVTRLPTGGAFPVCTGVRWRPLVRESEDVVMITAAAYAPRDEAGRCVDGLSEPIPLPVRLSAPLGSRRIVDGSDRTTHAVFEASRMPRPASDALPSGVQAAPIRWDERTRVATRRWQGTAAGGTPDVWISIGLATGIAAGAPVSSRTARGVTIARAAGTLWHGGGPYDVVVVRFSRAADTVEVRTVQDKGVQGTVDEALRIARSLS